MRRLIRATAPLCMMALTLAGCAAADDASVIEELQARHNSAARVQPFESLTDLLPNRTYRMGDGPEWSYSSSVVVGHFTSVEQGRAYSAEDAPGGVQVAFDSPDAAWRTFHATFAVDELVAGQPLSPDTSVGFTFGPDMSANEVKRDLTSLGTVLLFLRDSPVYEYAPDVLGVAWDGELIARVSPSGELSLPVLSPSDEAKMVDGASVSDLQSAARGAGEDIALDASGATVLSRQPAK